MLLKNSTISVTHVDHYYNYDAVNNTAISCAANGEGHRGAKPPPENQIFYFKKLKIQHVLYMNYPNFCSAHQTICHLWHARRPQRTPQCHN